MAEQVKKVSIKQTRGSIRRLKNQKDTLKCLGLGKIGRTVEHDLTPSIRGMIRAVSHLVEVREVK